MAELPDSVLRLCRARKQGAERAKKAMPAQQGSVAAETENLKRDQEKFKSRKTKKPRLVRARLPVRGAREHTRGSTRVGAHAWEGHTWEHTRGKDGLAESPATNV